MRPLISVILTTHHRPSLLSRALQSLVNQTKPDFQIVLCADEASEETKTVAAKYLRRDDSLLVLPHLRGPAETRNAGIAYSVGKRIIFLDDDDSFDIEFMGRVSDAVESCGTNDLLYFDYTRVEETIVDGTTRQLSKVPISQADKDPSQIMVGNFIPNNSFCIEADTARRTPFDHHLRSHEDWDFLIGISTLVKFTYVKLGGSNVHVSPEAGRNLTSHAAGSAALDYLSIYRKWPTVDKALTLRRQAQLRALGLNVSPEFL